MSEFFYDDEENVQNIELQEVADEFEKLSEDDRRLVLKIMHRLNESK